MQGRKKAEPGDGESTSAAGATPPICPAAQLEAATVAGARARLAQSRDRTRCPKESLPVQQWRNGFNAMEDKLKSRPEGDNSTSTARAKEKERAKAQSPKKARRSNSSTSAKAEEGASARPRRKAVRSGGSTLAKRAGEGARARPHKEYGKVEGRSKSSTSREKRTRERLRGPHPPHFREEQRDARCEAEPW